MILKTSYFYQIRNFLPYMIPVSVCLSDPTWYHKERGNSYIYKDKRNVVNGLRFEYMIVQNRVLHKCPCKVEEPMECDFLQEYYRELNKLDFDYIKEQLILLTEYEKEKLKLEKEPIIVFMLHEAWYNPCSERKMIQRYFKEHGIDCSELIYPISKEE